MPACCSPETVLCLCPPGARGLSRSCPTACVESHHVACAGWEIKAVHAGHSAVCEPWLTSAAPRPATHPLAGGHAESPVETRACLFRACAHTASVAVRMRTSGHGEPTRPALSSIAGQVAVASCARRAGRTCCERDAPCPRLRARKGGTLMECSFPLIRHPRNLTGMQTT